MSHQSSLMNGVFTSSSLLPPFDLSAMLELAKSIPPRPREVFCFRGTLAEFLAAAANDAREKGERFTVTESRPSPPGHRWRVNGLPVKQFGPLVWIGEHDDVRDALRGRLPIRRIN